MIPVSEPIIGEEEISAVVATLRRGEISGSFGRSIVEFEERVAEYSGVQHAVAVSSGTTALHLAVAATESAPGGEVLVSASTNIATALAAYHNGLVPVAVDSEPRTWNLDLTLLEDLITRDTVGIIPVHLFGHPVDMDALKQIAERHGLWIVEDCAESLGATCRGRMTGSFGLAGCHSFYANKIITTGEGGMVTTNNDEFAARLRLLRNLAFGTPRFLHEAPGFNFRLTALQAALGVTQIRKVEEIISQKRRVAATYTELLTGVRDLRLPVEEAWARNVYWMYGVVVEPNAAASRNQLMRALTAAGAESRTFFCPMGQQPFLQQQAGHRKTDCPVADSLWEQGLYLPSGPNLADADISTVAGVVRQVVGAAA